MSWAKRKRKVKELGTEANSLRPVSDMDIQIYNGSKYFGITIHSNCFVLQKIENKNKKKVISSVQPKMPKT